MAKGGKDLVLTAQCTKCTKWLYGKVGKDLVLTAQCTK